MRLTVITFVAFALSVPAADAYAGCTNDFQCGFGKKCVKPEGSYSLEGICVTPTDQFGNQDYSPRTPQAHPTEVKRCSFSTDCSLGESCVKKDYDLYGICVK